jgi:hypothetical protein
MVMFTILIVVTVGVLGGALAGAVTGRRAARRESARPAFDELSVDPDLDQKITEAARKWAMQQGEPYAAPFVANKLRLVHVLKRGRSRRRWRWSR